MKHTNRFLLIMGLFSLCASCSVYKSEGRKKFETETPQRVPVMEELTCYSQNPIEDPVIFDETSVKTTSDTLTVKAIELKDYPDHLVLVSEDSASSDYCLTPALSKSEYVHNKEKILNNLIPGLE
ncbi:MAG: hypothetical protein J0M15_08230 [Deltaproteobacteria bacterium]|jgi:hypothetical protein|nr:hypothetical protein [Deltaproteobacteria bacterium]